MTANTAPSVTQADQWCAHQIMHLPLRTRLAVGTEIAARHREVAEAPLRAQIEGANQRALVSAQMAQDYHAAHIEQRERADKAEAQIAVFNDKLETYARGLGERDAQISELADALKRLLDFAVAAQHQIDLEWDGQFFADSDFGVASALIAKHKEQTDVL